MKHAKTLLAWLLVLSLSLGLAITTTAADSTDAPLTVTRVVELADRKIEVYFSEPITLTTANSMGICLINQAETEIPMRRTQPTIEAKWQRTISNAGCVTLAEDGSKLTFTMKADYAAVYYAETDIGPRGNSQYKIRFFVQDLGSSTAGNGVIDAISAKADSSKKLTANALVGGVDYALAKVEYTAPFLKSVDKISNTSFRFNFSEAVTVGAATRPTLAVVNKVTHMPVNRVVGSGGAQWIKTAGEFTVADDGLSVTVNYDAAWITAATREYMAIGEDQCEIHVRLLGNDADTNCFLELIRDADNNAAQADFNNGSGGDAVAWNVSELVCPKVTIGSVGYNTVGAALKAAVSGNTVMLMQNNDSAGETLVVPAGVTLDLGGKKLTVANVVSFGNVIDSVGGGTLVMSDDRTEALLSLLPSNTMLPLYDATAGGYKFFNQTLVGGGPVEGTATSVKFGVKLSFTDTAAYELLKSGQVKLGLDLKIERDGHVNNLTYVFKDATIEAYADSVLGNSAGNYYVVLQISGLEAGDLIQAVPVMEMADGKAFDAEMKADTVLSYTVA